MGWGGVVYGVISYPFITFVWMASVRGMGY